MTVKTFATLTNLSGRTEVEKVKLLGFFFLKTEGKSSFTLQECIGWLVGLHFGEPNNSRLRRNISASADFVAGKSVDEFRLHKKAIDSLEQEIPSINQSETITHSGSILPASLYEKTRGYIENIASQINASYE